MEPSENCILVIFGASGHLTKNKLIPALYSLYERNLLPENFAVLGIGRTPLDDESFRSRLLPALQEEGTEGHESSTSQAETFIQNLYYQSIDTKSVNDYAALKDRITVLDKDKNAHGNCLFYLATPPDMYAIIAHNLAQHGLNREGGDNGFKRLVVEKPFGHDLSSALTLNDKLHSVFSEGQIFRIDHYLGKETVQNMLVFRFGNEVYEPLWNRNHIEKVEVTAAESSGVEGRGGYYEGTGALRDMMQNHLLHVVAMIGMEPPAAFHAKAVRNEIVKVFESLRPIQEDEVENHVVRGQYTGATVSGVELPGYREEEGVASDSKTDTFVAAKFFIDNWRWKGVPFYVRSGKRLPTRVTEAVITFKQTPQQLFRAADEADNCGSNRLVIRIQPDEGVLLRFNMKLPGAGFQTKSVAMDFHYGDLSDVYTPEAYERLLLDCIAGDSTLYTRNDAIEACWRFIQPIIDAWNNRPEEIKLYGYPSGTWGPREAHELFENPKEDWRYPCRNLAENGDFCEL